MASCNKSENSKTSNPTALGSPQEAPFVVAPVSESAPASEQELIVQKAEALAFFKALQSGDPAIVKTFLLVPDDCELMKQEIEKDGASVEKCRKGISELHEGIDQWLGRAAEQFKDLRPTGAVTFNKVQSPKAPKWAYEVSIEIENSKPIRLIAAFKFENRFRFVLGMKKSASPSEASHEDSAKVVAETEVDKTPPEREELESVEYQEDGNEPLLTGKMQFSGIAVKVVVAQPKEGKAVLAKLSVGTASPILIGFKGANYADYVKVVGEQLPAFGNDRLAMVQLFLESGEDIFARSMVTALVFLGDAKTKPKVLWQGEGEYRNTFGECETLNVISFVPFEGGQANVMRHREVVVNVPEDGDWISGDCKSSVAKPKKVKRIARVKIP